VRSPFDGKHPREIDHPCLGRAVGSALVIADETHDRGDVDDAAAWWILIAHDTARGLSSEEQPFQIRVEHQVPRIFGDVECHLPDVEARVVDEDVEPPCACLYRRTHARGDAVEVAHVELDSQGMAARSFQLGNRRLGSFQTVRELGGNHSRACGGQRVRGRLPDPRAGSGDQRGHTPESPGGS
jgi:hypothetical protein